MCIISPLIYIKKKPKKKKQPKPPSPIVTPAQEHKHAYHGESVHRNG